MQPELIQRIRERDQRLGTIVLAVAAILVVAAAFEVYPWLHNARHDEEVLIGLSLIGLILGAVLLIATWVTLSSDRLSRRMACLLVSMAALVAGWMVGYLRAESVQLPLRLDSRDSVLALGITPFLFTCLCLPLVVFRLFTSRVLSSRFQPAPVPGRVTITHFLTLTAWVAVVLAGLQMISGIFQPPQQGLRLLGLLMGISFSLSILGVLPAANLLFSSRYNMLIPLLGVIGISTGFAVLVGRIAFPTPTMAGVAIAGPGSVLYGLGAFGIRLLGYRMVHAAPPLPNDIAIDDITIDEVASNDT